MVAPGTFILSRTDSIGDVMLTLPLAGLLKARFPGCKVLFIGRPYTEAVAACCRYIDGFLERDAIIADPKLLSATGAEAILHVFPDKEIAKAAYDARIPLRVGTLNRVFHWVYCNRIVTLGRRNSQLHEAQLNTLLLKPFGFKAPLSLAEIGAAYGFTKVQALPAALQNLLHPQKINLILHPKSKGSAREWPLGHFLALAEMLPAEKYNLLVTGTAVEGALITAGCPELLQLPNVHNVTGQLTLAQLISLINASESLLACSTGPLHIAAALGKFAVGIYPPMRPLHPGRWAPVGTYTKVFCKPISCNACRLAGPCACIESISPQAVAEAFHDYFYDFFTASSSAAIPSKAV